MLDQVTSEALLMLVLCDLSRSTTTFVQHPDHYFVDYQFLVLQKLLMSILLHSIVQFETRMCIFFQH